MSSSLHNQGDAAQWSFTPAAPTASHVLCCICAAEIEPNAGAAAARAVAQIALSGVPRGSDDVCELVRCGAARRRAAGGVR